MSTKGYRSYRGRSRQGSRKTGIVILLVVLLLAACLFLFGQKYITYSDDGGLHFQIPISSPSRENPPREPVSEADDMNLVIEDPLPPEEPTTPVYGERHLISLSTLPATPELLQEQLSGAGANGFVYTVKDNAGLVHIKFPSALPSAVDQNAPEPDAIQPLLHSEDVISVARINCLHDSYYGWANMESAGLCQSSGYIWYDNTSYHWISPLKENAKRYVIDLCIACAEAGFDELLLDELSFPTRGKLHKIDYALGDTTRVRAIADLLQEIVAAMEPYDVKISLLLPEALFSPETGGELIDLSGQDPALLLPMVNAVYSGAEEDGTAQRASAFGGEKSIGFVTVTTVPPEDGSWCILS